MAVVLEARYAGRQKVALVLGNLNARRTGAFNAAFEPERGGLPADRRKSGLLQRGEIPRSLPNEAVDGVTLVCAGSIPWAVLLGARVGCLWTARKSRARNSVGSGSTACG